PSISPTMRRLVSSELAISASGRSSSRSNTMFCRLRKVAHSGAFSGNGPVRGSASSHESYPATANA
ncbi:MAG: hypothetical protein AAF593_14260, partial [Planctomycetota bacterium]